MREARGDEVLLDLSHPREVYETHGPFHPFVPYLPKHPFHAMGALREVLPWEAFIVAAATHAILRTMMEPQLAATLGFCVLLALATLQMMGSRIYVTEHCIIWRRAFGPLPFWRKKLPLAEITGIRVDRPENGSERFGDVVLVTRQRELRLRALRHPERVRKELLALRAVKSGAQK